MSRIDYSVKGDPETTSKAMGSELHISLKNPVKSAAKLRA